VSVPQHRNPLVCGLLTTDRLFAFSALLMTASTALLIWLYGVVNGQEKEGRAQGDVHKARSGNVKGR
jgi:hypothetical protein